MNALTQTNEIQIDTSILVGQVANSIIADVKCNVEGYAKFATTNELNVLESPTFTKFRQHLVNNTDLAVSTINKKLSHIRIYIRTGHEMGYIDNVTKSAFDAVRSVKATSQKDRNRQPVAQRTPLSKEEIELIINQCDTATLSGMMHRALLTAFATCGMRASEMCQLRQSQIIWKDGKDSSGWMIICSGGKGRTEDDQELIALPQVAKDAIDKWLAMRGLDCDAIFTGTTGRGTKPTCKAVSRVTAWQVVQRYTDAAGISKSVKPHDLRRYVGTTLAKKDIREAQKQLRHKNINTTIANYDLDGATPGITDGLL